jgi:hypothetical protein
MLQLGKAVIQGGPERGLTGHLLGQWQGGLQSSREVQLVAGGLLREELLCDEGHLLGPQQLLGYVGLCLALLQLVVALQHKVRVLEGGCSSCVTCAGHEGGGLQGFGVV